MFLKYSSIKQLPESIITGNIDVFPFFNRDCLEMFSEEEINLCAGNVIFYGNCKSSALLMDDLMLPSSFYGIPVNLVIERLRNEKPSVTVLYEVSIENMNKKSAEDILKERFLKECNNPDEDSEKLEITVSNIITVYLSREYARRYFMIVNIAHEDIKDMFKYVSTGFRIQKSDNKGLRVISTKMSEILELNVSRRDNKATPIIAIKMPPYKEMPLLGSEYHIGQALYWAGEQHDSFTFKEPFAHNNFDEYMDCMLKMVHYSEILISVEPNCSYPVSLLKWIQKKDKSPQKSPIKDYTTPEVKDKYEYLLGVSGAWDK